MSSDMRDGTFLQFKKYEKSTKEIFIMSDKYSKNMILAYFLCPSKCWKNGGIIMRIDAYMQVSQLYNANKTRKTAKSDKGNTADSLEISSFGSAYQVAKQAASQGSAVRTDRIKEIQEQMAAGTYRVPIEDVADKMADTLLS